MYREESQIFHRGRSIRQEKSASPAVLKGSGPHRLLPDTAWREKHQRTWTKACQDTADSVVTRGNALLDTTLPSGCNLTTVNQSPCDNFRLQPDHSEPVSL
ncbi:hypothetical protein ACOMHN_022871 [Nucella lapillus]